jgi:enediyne biosynthesis protein E4
MKIFSAYLVIAFLLSGIDMNAQIFTRVVDSLNAVTTDMAESGGGSWVDINNDGLLDLFVANGNLSSQDNSLYLNAGSGNFIKVTTGNIVTDGGSSIGSTWADYNHDGFLDCFVTNRNNFGNFLYNGNGDTVFTKIITGSIVTDIGNSNSSSWVDADNNGILDLYTVNFQNADFFYLGDGSPGYTLTSQAPVSSGTQFSIPGAWADYNNDLFPDLFIGNSGTQNDFLFTNTGSLVFTQSTFTDASATLGASWADYDNDGDLDLFVANYLNDTSILYKNSGTPSFLLTPFDSSGILIIGNSVGSAWGDVDDDGDLDLFVCDDGSNNHLFLNSGFPNYTFTVVSVGQVVSDAGNSFGCAFGDYDNDGHLDLFVANRLNQQNFLYHNDGNANNWITIKCTGIASNSSALGAKVFVKATINGIPVWQMQEVSVQTGYNSQNLWLHFGLAQSSVADTIVIKWPSGITDTCRNVNANIFYTALEGQCMSTTISESNNLASQFFISPNPLHSSFILHAPAAFIKSSFNIYNSIGEIVCGQIINSGQQKINLAVKPGIYYLQIGGITKKLIVY